MGMGLFLQNPITGIVLLPSNKENTALRPSPKQVVIDISFVYGYNRTNRKCHRLSNLHLVDLAISDMSKYRQISVMVQKQMELHRPLRLAELAQSKRLAQSSMTVASRAEQFVLKSKPPFAKVQLPALP